MPIERMKTPGSRKWSASRIRSPSSAPCVNGLDGSTETTPTVCSCARTWRTSARDQARLADARRAGDADRVRAARVRVELAHELVGQRVAVLDERDRARERAPVAGADARRRALARPVLAAATRTPASASTAALRRVLSPTAARQRRSATQPTTSASTTPTADRVDPARADASVSGPATTMPRPEHGVVDAHQQREHAAAQRRRARRAGRAVSCRRRRRRSRSRRARSTAAPTQTFGDDAPQRRCRAPCSSDARRVDERDRRAARASVAARGCRSRGRGPMPPQRSPKPKSPASNESLARKTSATLTQRVAEHDDRPATSTESSARERTTSANPSREVAPVAAADGRARVCEAARRDPRDEQRRDANVAALTQYARSGPTPRRSRRRGAGPSVQRRSRPAGAASSRGARSSVVDEVRQARVDGRAEEAGREARRPRRARRSPPAQSANGSAHEDAEAHEVGADHQRAGARAGRRAGPSESPRTTAGRKLGDQERADPRAGVRAVVDVDRERDRPRARCRGPSRASRGRAAGSPGRGAQELELAPRSRSPRRADVTPWQP